MAGIIERYAKTAMTLKQRSAIVDGKPTWSSTACLGMVLDYTGRDIDDFGAIKNGKIFLVAPMAFTPALPGMMLCDGVEYEIKGIKTYRNLKGVLLGYRIAVAGAA